MFPIFNTTLATWIALAMLLSTVRALAILSKLPPETIKIITKYEGFYPLAQANFFGNTVVGFGHRCQEQQPFNLSCSQVSLPISSSDAYGLLDADLENTIQCLESFFSQNVQLNNNQMGALASWAYAITCELAGQSDLITRLNNSEDPTKVATEELPLYDRHQGNIVPFLIDRRSDELALFNTPA